jgi:PAS domain S-box-containing protein
VSVPFQKLVFFDLLSDLTGFVNIQLDASGRVISASNQFLESIGKPEEAPLFSDLLIQEDREIFLAKFKNLIEHKLTFKLISRIRTQFSSEYALEFVCGRFQENEQPLYVIHGVPLAETESLDTNSKNLRLIESIAQASPDWLCVFDLVFSQSHFSNDRLKSFTGRSREDEVTFDEFVDHHIHPEDREIFLQTTQIISQSKSTKILSTEYRIKTSQPNEYRWVRSRLTPFSRLLDGSLRHLFMVTTDITDQRRSLDQLRIMITDMPAAVAMLDTQMRYIAVSDQWVQDYGLESFHPLEGRSHYEVFPSVPERWKEVHQRALHGETLSNDDDHFTDGKGSDVWVKWTAKPWMLQGEIGGILLLTEVITERKLMEQEIELARAHQIESSKLAALGEMAAGVGHEINNPLSIILGRTDLLLEKISRSQIEAHQEVLATLRLVHQQGDRIASIVGSLRSFARNEKDEQVHEICLQNIVAQSLVLCEEKMKHTGIKLKKLMPEDPILVMGRASEVIQILINLLTNACDAVNELDDRQISIEMTTFGTCGRIRIWDSGPGVSVENESKIFRPFFTTKAIGYGTGLGLSLSHSLAERMSGRLKLDRTQAPSCFLLELPLSQKAHEDFMTSLDDLEQIL